MRNPCSCNCRQPREEVDQPVNPADIADELHRSGSRFLVPSPRDSVYSLHLPTVETVGFLIPSRPAGLDIRRHSQIPEEQIAC